MNASTIRQTSTAQLWQVATTRPWVDQPINFVSATTLPLPIHDLACPRHSDVNATLRGGSDKIFVNLRGPTELTLHLSFDGYLSQKYEFYVGPETTRGQFGRDAANMIAQYMNGYRKTAPTGPTNCDLRAVTPASATLTTLTCFSGMHFAAVIRMI